MSNSNALSFPFQGGSLFQLPGGAWMWTPTASSGSPPLAPPLANAQGLDGLLAGLLPALGSALSAGAAANPQAALLVAALGALFQFAHALKTQMQASPPGSNPSLELLDQMFWAQVLKVFSPQVPATPPGAQTAALG